MSKTTAKRNLWAPLFFPLTILYEELLLRLFSVDAARFDYHYLYLLVFSAAFGIKVISTTFTPNRGSPSKAA